MSNSNLIDRFVDIVTPYCDAPEVFIRTGSYHLIASLLGRFCTVPEMPSGNRPNPWFICSSIPGRTRRSVVLNYVSYVYKGVLIKFYKDIMDVSSEDEEKDMTEDEIDKLREKKIYEFIDKTIIESGSPEGMMDHLGDAYKKGVDCFAIMSPEFGAVLSSIMQKGYQRGVSTLLSKMKYGESGSAFLSRRGGKKGYRYVPPDLFVTMFATMQEPDQYLTEVQSRQGLLRRLMVTYVKTSDLSMDDWEPPLRKERRVVWNNLDVYVDDLYHKMRQLGGNCWYVEKRADKPAVPVDILCYEAINKIAEDMDADLISESSDYNIYRQGYWEQLTELATIHCIGRFNPMEGADGWMFAVGPDDLAAAVALHDDISKNAREMMDSITTTSDDVRTQERTIERIYRFVRRAGKEGISRSELYTRAKYKSIVLDDYIKTLIISDRIYLDIIITPGRDKTIYIATEFRDDTTDQFKDQIEGVA